MKLFPKTKAHKDMWWFGLKNSPNQYLFPCLEKVFLVLFLVFLPTQLGKHFWFSTSFVWGLKIDYLSPTIYLTDLFLLGSALFAFLTLKKKGVETPESHLVLPIIIFLIFNFLFCLNKVAFLIHLARIMELLLLIRLLIRNSDFGLQIISRIALPLWAITEALISWGQIVKQASLGGLLWFLGERSFSVATPGIARTEINHQLTLRPYGTFSHPNSLAGFILISILLQFYLAKRKIVNKNALFWASLFAGTTTLFLTFSRIAILTFVLIFLLELGRKISREKLSKRFLLIFIGLGLILFSSLYIVKTSLVSFNLKNPSINNRLLLIKTAGRMFQSSPLIGVGLNNFIYRLPRFWPQSKISLLWLQPVHNIYFLVLAETGLIGFSIVLLLLKNLLRGSEGFLFQQDLKNIFLAIGITGIFDHYWLTLPQNFLLMGLVLALFLSKKNPRP